MRSIMNRFALRKVLVDTAMRKYLGDFLMLPLLKCM